MKMTNKRLFQVGFLVLIIMNAILIFLLVQGPKRPPMRPGPGQHSITKKISDKLSLSEDQLADYHLMAKQHREQIQVLEVTHRELIKGYFETLNDSNSVDADSLKNEILKIDAEKLQQTYEHFEALKTLLDKNQKARFELIIRDILKVLIGDEKKMPPPPRD